MFHLTRKLMMIAAVAGVLAGTGGGAAALAATSAPAAAAVRSVLRCYTQDLSAGLHGAENGPGREAGFILTLTNVGQRSCSLDGYPGLGLQDFGHHTLPSHAFWGPTVFDRDPGRQPIVLSPGETVSASLAFTTGTTQHAVWASYLVVTPPSAFEHLVVGPFSRAMAIPVYRGDLYVTAMARHTPHP